MRKNIFGKVNCSETNIASIPGIPKDIEGISICHSALTSMEGVATFRLKILNLSSNHI